MSSWLKRQQPIKLYQSSDIPYIILEDGVHLCYDNCYGIREDRAEHNICFYAHPSSFRRINTYFYRFNSFPTVISFTNVLSLDDAIIEGKTIKQAADTDCDPKNITIMKSDYIRMITSSDLSSINDLLEGFDHSFVLVGDTIDPQVRLFEDVAIIIPHRDWRRTAVTVAHNIKEQKDRKYCWTSSIPEMSIACYGVTDSDELIEINKAFRSIGIKDLSISWET